MLLYRGFKTKERIKTLLVGSFDGFHLGHKALLEDAVKPIGILTFYPNPKFVIRNLKIKKSLSSLPVLIPYLKELGISQINLIHFTRKFSETTAEEFFQIIKETLSPEIIIVGEDARVGKGGLGTVDVMKTLFPNLKSVSHKLQNGRKIGSRWIREAIESGDIDQANLLLGRAYSIRGNVVKGDGRGKSLGYPTANLSGIREVTPAAGVYVTETLLKGECVRSVTNIGTRPTFDGTSVAVETHLLNTSTDDFYNSRVIIRFLKRIREERKFNGINELTNQIKQDCAYAASFQK